MSYQDSGRVPESRIQAWRRYLRFWRSNADADVADEIRFHLESATAELIAQGMTPEAARAQALQRFGDLTAIARALLTLSHERERAMEWRDRFETMHSDLRFAMRQLRKAPGFTIVATLTLALGIGANSAIFSVVDAVLLRPLPYAHADRLLSLKERNGANDTDGMFVAFGNYADWAQRVHAFDSFAVSRWNGFTLTGAGDPRYLQALRVNAGYWKTLQVPPTLGRYFSAREDAPAAPHVVVISHGLWRDSFGGDSAIIGRSIALSGVPYTVIGVASPRYSLPRVDAWTPLALTTSELAEHGDHELTVVGLLRERVTSEEAVAELTKVETALAQQYPHKYFDGGIIAKPLRESIVGPVRLLLLILFGAVALVLLIACLNVANLQLARAAVRRKEIAVRNALGAGRSRIIAQLLTENLVFALGGAVLGIGVAAFGIRFLVRSNPLGVPRLDGATLDAPVLIFALLVAVGSGVGCGMLPAFRASRLDLQQVLRDGSRTDSATPRNRLRATLVVCKISLAMMLLVGAGLLVRSAILLQHVPPGFDSRNLLVTDIGLPGSRYPNDSAAAARFDEILRNVSSLPGVASAALVSRMPIVGGGGDCNFRRDGAASDGASFNAQVRVATPSCFETLRLPILRGRNFSSIDAAGAPRVAVINRRFAQKLFGDEEAIGHRITCNDPASKNALWLTVIAISGDVHADGLSSGIRDQVYSPLSQSPQYELSLVVRGSVPVLTVAPAIRRTVAALDPLLPLGGLQTVDEAIGSSLAVPRFTSQLLSALGVLGLILAVIGIYGVIAFFVAQRTHEIGIRMALGADTGRVLDLVLRQGVILAAIGIAIGTAASLMLTRTLDNLLYGITARDPLTFVGVAMLLALVSLIASFVPARRASRVDPLAALRDS